MSALRQQAGQKERIHRLNQPIVSVPHSQPHRLADTTVESKPPGPPCVGNEWKSIWHVAHLFDCLDRVGFEQDEAVLHFIARTLVAVPLLFFLVVISIGVLFYTAASRVEKRIFGSPGYGEYRR